MHMNIQSNNTPNRPTPEINYNVHQHKSRKIVAVTQYSYWNEQITTVCNDMGESHTQSE